MAVDSCRETTNTLNVRDPSIVEFDSNLHHYLPLNIVAKSGLDAIEQWRKLLMISNVFTIVTFSMLLHCLNRFKSS